MLWGILREHRLSGIAKMDRAGRIKIIYEFDDGK
jgi:hypothetical protein